jgi:hypothetical protein
LSETSKSGRRREAALRLTLNHLSPALKGQVNLLELVKSLYRELGFKEEVNIFTDLNQEGFQVT